MVVHEMYNKELVKSYSNKKLWITADGQHFYIDAIDLKDSVPPYEETDKPITMEEPTNE